MNAQEIIRYIAEAEKKTPVKLYLKEKKPIDFGDKAKVFGTGDKIVFGDWKDLSVILEEAGGAVRSLDGPLDYEEGGPVLAAADPGNLDVLEAEVRKAFPEGIPRRSLLQELHGGDVLDGLVLEREEGVVQS